MASALAMTASGDAVIAARGQEIEASRPDPASTKQIGSGLIRQLSQFGPRTRLDAGEEFVAALAVRLEYRCLALADVGPVAAERIHNVWLVRNDHDIVVGRRSLRDELAERLCASVLFGWRDIGPALGEVGGRRDFAKAQQPS